jgi:hypothetical protein
MNKILYIDNIPCGLTVRISGLQPEGPGSTPGMGTFLQFMVNSKGTLYFGNKYIFLNFRINVALT